MLENRQTQYRLRPTLPRRAKLDDALLELGIRGRKPIAATRASCSCGHNTLRRRRPVAGAGRRPGNQPGAGNGSTCSPAGACRQPVLSRAAKGPAGQLRRQEPLRPGQHLHLAGVADVSLGRSQPAPVRAQPGHARRARNVRRRLDVVAGSGRRADGRAERLSAVARRALRNGGRRIPAGDDSHACPRPPNVCLPGQRFALGSDRFA